MAIRIPRAIFDKAACAGLLAAALTTAFAAEPPTAGRVVLAAGPVYLVEDADTHVPVARGADILPGQTIVTGEGGFAHIQMSDGGLVAVRPFSMFQVDVFDYRHDASSDRVRYHLEQGTARSITGSVGEVNKEAFRLNTPVAAVGVRGTDFVVTTDKASSKVAVNSGAVVVAALGDGCSASGFGACASDGVLLGAASDAANRYVEVVRGEHVPRMVQEADSTRESAVPAQPPEAATVRVASERTNPVRADESQQQQPGLVAPPPVAPPVQPEVPPVAPPSGPVAVPTDAHWGRWDNISTVDDTSVVRVAHLQAAGKRIHIANRVYAAGVDAMPTSLPRAGRADFVPAGGEGMLVTPGANIALAVGGGSLGVNFDNRTFDTTARFDGNGTSYATAASGTVDARGFLHSDPTRSDSTVTGALGAGLQSAVTTVQRELTDGTLAGVVVWGRQ